MILGELIL